jgi:hypothetical protein
MLLQFLNSRIETRYTSEHLIMLLLELTHLVFFLSHCRLQFVNLLRFLSNSFLCFIQMLHNATPCCNGLHSQSLLPIELTSQIVSLSHQFIMLLHSCLHFLHRFISLLPTLLSKNSFSSEHRWQ